MQFAQVQLVHYIYVRWFSNYVWGVVGGGGGGGERLPGLFGLERGERDFLFSVLIPDSWL